jgi:hypothetical protein
VTMASSGPRTSSSMASGLNSFWVCKENRAVAVPRSISGVDAIDQLARPTRGCVWFDAMFQPL